MTPKPNALQEARAKTPQYYLNSPGEGKQWGAKTKIPGRIKQAATRAYIDAHNTLTTQAPIPQGLPGRISRATTPFINSHSMEENAWIIKSAQNTAYAATTYTHTYQQTFNIQPPGKLLAAATENIYTLILEKQPWPLILAAIQQSATQGSWRIDLAITNIAAGTGTNPPWHKTPGRTSNLDALIATNTPPWDTDQQKEISQ